MGLLDGWLDGFGQEETTSYSDMEFGDGVELGGDEYSFVESDYFDTSYEPVFSWDDTFSGNENIFTGESFEGMFDEFNVDELDLDEDTTNTLNKVPSKLWDRLLDFGVAGLAEWLRQKNKPEPRPRGGGGGGRRAAEAATKAMPVGTRTVNG